MDEKLQTGKPHKYGICLICRKKKSLTEEHLKNHDKLFSVMICRDCHDVLEWAKRELGPNAVSIQARDA